jgi:hypothetical protein
MTFPHEMVLLFVGIFEDAAMRWDSIFTTNAALYVFFAERGVICALLMRLR